VQQVFAGISLKRVNIGSNARTVAQDQQRHQDVERNQKRENQQRKAIGGVNPIAGEILACRTGQSYCAKRNGEEKQAHKDGEAEVPGTRGMDGGGEGFR